MKKHVPPLLWLAAAVCCVALGITATLYLGSSVPAKDYDLKADAAARMQACMEALKRYKAEEGLALSGEDWFKTGMLGDRLSGITTTLGVLEAKRTTANSDMAALVVQMLEQADVQPGQAIGAGCSGSFPSLNLALLCACDAMGVDCRYITSIGASSYGANQPQLTFPEMACRLADEGLISHPPLAVSAGGQNDLGQDMDSQALNGVWRQLAAWSLIKIEEADYPQNLRLRTRLYEADGPISCFVAVGGGLVTSGRADAQLGQGVLRPDRVGPITDKSGLLERYSAAGLPVIELLNVKKLVADYDLPYDPQTLPAPGTSAIYYTTTRPRLPALAGIAACIGCFVLFARESRRQKGEAA